MELGHPWFQQIPGVIFCRQHGDDLGSIVLGGWRLAAGDFQPARRWCKAGTARGRTVGLADLEAKAPWFDSHSPLAERICRIHGRAIPVLADCQKENLADPRGEILRKDTLK